jgi:ABC-type lipoprotein export system ATPase subunit
MDQEWKYPGSKWWKFDFHVHTPASLKDYEKPDTTVEEWLKSCVEAGLDCVVVADHNCGDWIAKLKTAYDELASNEPQPDWFRPLTIFPGVEITVSLGTGRVHLLGVFDPNITDGSTISAVLGQCGITSGFGDSQNTSTDTTFEVTAQKIKSAGGIPIAAHIDGNHGLLKDITTLNPELQRSLNSIYAAEFCDLHAFDSAALELRKLVDGLAPLAGSDAHSPIEIGRHATWVKMSRPSIEGLRLALLDKEFCLSFEMDNPNRTPDFFIKSLEITSMHHCGRVPGKPLRIEFHPRFNALIGGRGSGKSTILDSIRIAARREGELNEFDVLRDNLARFKAHATRKGVMLEDTELLLGIGRMGDEYRLRWRFDSTGMVLEKKKDKNWTEVEAGDLRQRFPMSMFSQKQIEKLAENPNGLLEILDRSPEVNRAEWNQRWEEAKNRFLKLRFRKREFKQQLEREEEIKARLTDVEHDLMHYEERGHGAIFKQFQQRNEQQRALPLVDDFGGLADRILLLAEEPAINDFPFHLFADDDPAKLEVSMIHGEAALALKDVQLRLRELVTEVGGISAERKRKLEESSWYRDVSSALEKYHALVQEYELKDSHFDPSLYGKWVQEKARLHQELMRLDALKRDSEQLQVDLRKEFDGLTALRRELYDKRTTFTKSVIGDNAYVRMEVVPYGDTEEVNSEYRSLLGLDENSSFSSSILDENGGLLWNLSKWEEGSKSSRLPQLIQEIKLQTLNLAAGEMQDALSCVKLPFIKRLQGIAETHPSNLDELLCWWPEDLLRVKYVKDPAKSKFEELEKGSAGQKAAAILAFLLSHGETPLIIDQPEDDLDNALIYDLVVRQIHENKKNRQLIVVTHNPNIVVNGDAELVYSLHLINGQIQVEVAGGLEEQAVRNRICDIMEGGREAFDKRYKRITLEV